MRIYFITPLLFSILFSQQPNVSVSEQMKNTGLETLHSYTLLKELTSIGSRLSGSDGYEKAVVWSKSKLLEAGCDSVWLEKVMIPHWVRGNIEKAYIHNGRDKESVSICALGGSIATPKKGLRADVVEVMSFDELEQLGKQVKGKIVFYNRPFDRTKVRVGEAYGGAVKQRTEGAIEAGKLGAVGVIVRSMTNAMDDVPHTGMMKYNDSVPKIPAVAVSTIGAEKLSAILHQNKNVSIEIRLDCRTLPDVQSFNVIGEIKGAELPNEVVLLGGHLDCWDKGTGAHDDGAGVVHCINAINLIKQLSVKSKRTIRVVLFANEENGMRGADAYAGRDENKNEKLIAAIESDFGGFEPKGFNIKTDTTTFEKLKKYSELLSITGANDFRFGGGGADINELKQYTTVLIGLNPDSQRYFDLHHSNNDTIDKVHPRELELGSISVAILSWAIAQDGI